MSEAREAYERLLASQPENEKYYETIVLSHSKFSKTYYLVRETIPVTARLITGETVTFEPASIAPTNAVNTNDLDQSATFTISDLDNVLDTELDNIPFGDTESPKVGYGIYHSEYLDEPVEYTEYDVKSVPQKKGLFTIKCGAPDLNSDETGEVFDLDRFPMLRGL